MKLLLVRVFGILVAGLAIAGLFTSGHLLDITNTDLPVDILRLLLAAYLLYVGFIDKNDEQERLALIVFGSAYVGLAIVGVINSSVGGLLPSGLTGFDIVFHLLSGALALIVALPKKLSQSVKT